MVCVISSRANSIFNSNFTSPTAIPNYPGGSYGVPLSMGDVLDASGGDVTVTYLGWGGAAYDEQLYIVTPGGNNLTGIPLMDNHATPAGYTVNLGSFAAGTEVEFDIFVDNTGHTWYDGPGIRNADGAVHAYMINNFSYMITSPSSPYNGLTGTGTYVGFEDEAYPGGDFNYADLQFVFYGVQSTPSVPDGAETLSLMTLALVGLSAVRRKLRPAGVCSVSSVT